LATSTCGEKEDKNGLRRKVSLGRGREGEREWRVESGEWRERERGRPHLLEIGQSAVVSLLHLFFHLCKE
jgi:hypothetical protein